MLRNALVFGMAYISAIELENFQSIERRTRFELRPITLLFGPNSAGKSSLFDALELLQVLLDPTRFDEHQAAQMVHRWARRINDTEVSREMFLAIEYPFTFEDLDKVWADDSNWTGTMRRTKGPSFYINGEDEVAEHGLDRASVRMELRLKVAGSGRQATHRLSEFRCLLNDHQLVNLGIDPIVGRSSQSRRKELDGVNDWTRLLTVSNHFEFVNHALLSELKKIKGKGTWNLLIEDPNSVDHVQAEVTSLSLSPLKLLPVSSYTSWTSKELTERISRNAHDIIFYFGTLLFRSLRHAPGIVKSDRRTPNPHEALAVVDLGFRGWWSQNSFSPSSPASLLMSKATYHDEHFHGLAKLAHADLITQLLANENWVGGSAANQLESVRSQAEILNRINIHLEKHLFIESGYKIACASTLLVPIDLRETDPWAYYSLAQPAAVRLFLKDADNRSVEFEDVGSGVPFVLPILYVLAIHTLVRVQQPELHLHPALQSTLADVFIREFNRAAHQQFIIETHSEHILLRLLRRLRESEHTKHSELSLSSKDLSIFYFDPIQGKGTEVSKLDVTPMGDFTRDWPRGFFEERNEDLFYDWQ